MVESGFNQFTFCDLCSAKLSDVFLLSAVRLLMILKLLCFDLSCISGGNAM